MTQKKISKSGNPNLRLKKKFNFYRLQNWKKSSVQGLNFSSLSLNWHILELALPLTVTSPHCAPPGAKIPQLPVYGIPIMTMTIGHVSQILSWTICNENFIKKKKRQVTLESLTRTLSAFEILKNATLIFQKWLVSLSEFFWRIFMTIFVIYRDNS